jgi:hypothetical protein
MFISSVVPPVFPVGKDIKEFAIVELNLLLPTAYCPLPVASDDRRLTAELVPDPTGIRLHIDYYH